MTVAHRPIRLALSVTRSIGFSAALNVYMEQTSSISCGRETSFHLRTLTAVSGREYIDINYCVMHSDTIKNSDIKEFK